MSSHTARRQISVLLAAALAGGLAVTGSPGLAAPPGPLVNQCGEAGFDPKARRPNTKIQIPVPYPVITPVPEPGPPPDNTRVKPAALPIDPCADPCPEVRAQRPLEPPPPAAPAAGEAPFRLPQIDIKMEKEPIPVAVPSPFTPPAPQPRPPAAVQPAQPGPAAAAVGAPRLEGVRMVSQLTGRGSPNRTDVRWQMLGTDLGLIWESKPGEVLVAFGDTFGKGWKLGGAGGDDAEWRSNTIARSTSRDLAKGLTFSSMVQSKPCYAAELLGSRKVSNYEITTIPTSGFAIGKRQYMSYMSVNNWAKVPGHWFTNYGGLAYSDDDGETWTKSQHARWENMFGLGKFQVAAMTVQGDFVYMFGTPNGRVGTMGLARVPKAEVLNKTAYQYWVDGTWAPSAVNDATPVTNALAGEVSVRFDDKSGLWQMSYLDAPRGAIVLRESKSPQGAWSEPAVLATAEDYPTLYGGFIHPWSTSKDLFFTVSHWDTYQVYLMHAKIAR